MMGELQDRLQKLQRSPSNFTTCVKRKIEDLEKMLLIADLQRKLQHQRSVSASLPSSSTMKSLVRKTEAQLAAAVLLAPAVEHVPDPGQEEAAQQDGVRDVGREEALRQLTEAGLFPLGSPAQQLQSRSQVRDLQTKMERLQSKVAQLQYKVTELGKKGDTSRVSGQHLATGNCAPVQKRFKEEILKDRVKLLDLVKSTFEKKGAKEDSKDEVPDEDAAIKAPALVRDGILVHTKDAPEVADDVESTEEQYDPDVVIKETNKDEVAVNMECDGFNEPEQSVSKASLQVGLDMDKVTDMSKPLSVNKTSAIDKSGEATKDESIEEQKSKENPPKKTWKKILKMKIIQLMQKRMKGSDFLSNQKNPPEKSAAGPNVMRSSSSIKPDLTKDELLRKFTSARHNLQLPSSCVSVGACSDQLKGGKLFISEESFQKFSDRKDGGDQYKREVSVRTLAAKKSEDNFESLGRIIKKEAFVHADPSVRGNKCVIDAILVMIPY